MFEHIKKGDEVRLTCGKVGSCQGATDKTIWLLVGMTMIAFDPKTGWECSAPPKYRIDQSQYEDSNGTYTISAKDAYQQTHRFEVTEEVLTRFFVNFRKRQESMMELGYTSLTIVLQQERVEGDSVLRFREGAVASFPFISKYTTLVSSVTDILLGLGYSVTIEEDVLEVSWEPKE